MCTLKNQKQQFCDCNLNSAHLTHFIVVRLPIYLKAMYYIKMRYSIPSAGTCVCLLRCRYVRTAVYVCIIVMEAYSMSHKKYSSQSVYKIPDQYNKTKI